jgi:hypothetical protein
MRRTTVPGARSIVTGGIPDTPNIKEFPFRSRSSKSMLEENIPYV